MGNVLKEGSRGLAVKDLQRSLGITADGIFGPQTAAAVRGFQKSQGLKVDGVVGKNTTGRLIGHSMWPEPSVVSNTNLKRGMRGPEIATIQRTLGVQADGIFGPQTEAALKRFQTRNGLNADGIFGTQSRNKMFGDRKPDARMIETSTILKRGMRGPDVINLQHRLGVTPDGIFGPKTQAALKKFQTKNGLTSDGLFGPKTKGVLFSQPQNQPGYKPPLKQPTDFLLKRGMKNEAVKELQGNLGVKGKGIFGPKTQAAVKGFQTGHGLTVNGKVDPKTWAEIFAVSSKINRECPTYKNPPKIAPAPSQVHKASDIINRIYIEDWVENINNSRQEYAKASGKTLKPYTQEQVETVLKKAGKSVLVEDEAAWKSKMAELRAKGLQVNDIGVTKDCAEVYLGSAIDGNRLLINPYIKNRTVRWSTQVHEIEHVVKELAGIPSSEMVVGAKTAADTIHHRTTRDSDRRTVYRIKQAPPEPWYKRLVNTIFD